MITKQSFNFSDSLVLRELQRIGREKGLITEDAEPFFVPELKKQASNKLEQTGNLVLDAVNLANALKRKGYVKQAEILVEKALTLKKSMAEGGYDSLYNFWSETGKDLENAAHKDSNDVAGHKVPDLNEAQEQIHSTVRKDPTGNVQKAALMAAMFEMVVKEAREGGGDLIDKYRKGYDETYPDSKKFFDEKIQPLINVGFVTEDLKINADTAVEWFNSRSIVKTEDVNLDTFAYINPAVTEYSKYMKQIGDSESYIRAVIDGNTSAAKDFLNRINPENWENSVLNFAKMWSFIATAGTAAGVASALIGPSSVLMQQSNADDIKARNLDDTSWKITGISSYGKRMQAARAKMLNKTLIESNIKKVIAKYKSHREDFQKLYDYVNGEYGAKDQANNAILALNNILNVLPKPKEGEPVHPDRLLVQQNLADIQKIVNYDKFYNFIEFAKGIEGIKDPVKDLKNWAISFSNYYNELTGKK